MTGEVIWRVSSLSITDEAVELFTDRARLVRPEFAITDENTATVADICQRLDGMPLAIELAAARVRALSVTDILDQPARHRFRLLTGGARTAVRRQQTLRASVDWSACVAHRRRACDLPPASGISGRISPRRRSKRSPLTITCSATRCSMKPTLLVDKSLVIAENLERANAIPTA